MMFQKQRLKTDFTTTMDDNHESIERKRKYNRLSKTRQRARDKALLENRHVPARLKKRKRGRKRLPIPDDIEVRKRRELGRRKYVRSKMTIDPQGKVITGNGVRTRNRSNGSAAGDSYVKESCFDPIVHMLLPIKSSGLKRAKQYMQKGIDETSRNFVWLRDMDNISRLYMKEDKNKKMSNLVPWVHIKMSKIPSAGSGLFASRNFNKDETITLYLGDIKQISESSNYSFGYSKRFVVDIKGNETRFHKYIGAHMINDMHFCEGNKDEKLLCNNASLNTDFRITAKRYIEEGEEISMSYNLSNY